VKFVKKSYSSTGLGPWQTSYTTARASWGAFTHGEKLPESIGVPGGRSISRIRKDMTQGFHLDSSARTPQNENRNRKLLSDMTL